MQHVVIIIMGETDDGTRLSVDRDAGGFRLETCDNQNDYIASGLIDLDLALRDVFNMAEQADGAYRALTAPPPATPVYPTVETAQPLPTPAIAAPTKPNKPAPLSRAEQSAVLRAQIATLHAEGKNVHEIATAAHVNTSTVYAHLKALQEATPLAPATPFQPSSNGNGSHA